MYFLSDRIHTTKQLGQFLGDRLGVRPPAVLCEGQLLNRDSAKSAGALQPHIPILTLGQGPIDEGSHPWSRLVTCPAMHSQPRLGACY